MDFLNMSCKEIEKYISSVEGNARFSLINILQQDTRKSVNKLALKLKKEEARANEEIERLNKLWEIEKNYFDLGYNLVAGLDEAGRGPLAGPIVAAAVILPKEELIIGVNDSKKLSEKKRDELYKKIQDTALAIGVGIVNNRKIDEINIFNATKLAMKRAINSLKIKPEFLLIDALDITDINIEQESIVKGDSRSISIASASIIAKVTRDNMVKSYDKEYPQYNFSKHKGYGTKEHYEAIRKHGITPLHRKSFLKNIK